MCTTGQNSGNQPRVSYSDEPRGWLLILEMVSLFTQLWGQITQWAKSMESLPSQNRPKLSGWMWDITPRGKLEVILKFESGRLGRATLGAKSPKEQSGKFAYPCTTGQNCGNGRVLTCPEEPRGLWLILRVLVLVVCQVTWPPKKDEEQHTNKPRETLTMDVGHHALKRLGVHR